jgi:hypothetical protein
MTSDKTLCQSSFLLDTHQPNVRVRHRKLCARSHFSQNKLSKKAGKLVNLTFTKVVLFLVCYTQAKRLSEIFKMRTQGNSVFFDYNGIHKLRD